jgi:hypothetical protein
MADLLIAIRFNLTPGCVEVGPSGPAAPGLLDLDHPEDHRREPETKGELAG